jgi:hypothetical protein
MGLGLKFRWTVSDILPTFSETEMKCIQITHTLGELRQSIREATASTEVKVVPRIPLQTLEAR